MSAHADHREAIETAWSETEKVRGLIQYALNEYRINLRGQLAEAVGTDRSSPTTRAVWDLADRMQESLQSATSDLGLIKYELEHYAERI